MRKIGYVVCGNSGIDYIDHSYDIRVFRSQLLVGEREYTDFTDIKAEEFYSMIKENPDLHPTTAQTATGVMLETYEQMRDEGYEEIVVVTISSKLSGTFEGAQMAANMVNDVSVTVFDSKSVAYGEAYMVLEAARLGSEGKSVPQIIDHLSWIRENQGLLVSVDTLKYLVKNGRLSGASGFLGSFLKIKPMLMLSREGKIEPVEKIRTRQKAIERIIEKFTHELYDASMEVFVVHANAYDMVEYVQKELKKRLDYADEITTYPLTPVVGAHAGHGALAIGWVRKKA